MDGVRVEGRHDPSVVIVDPQEHQGEDGEFMVIKKRTLCAAISMLSLWGCGGGANKTDEPSQSEITAACEEACLEEGACDPTSNLPDGYCQTDCSEAAQHSSDIDCASEYHTLVTCQASSNDCPVPSCLEEARAYDDCVPEGQGDPCDQYCFMMANVCGSETDNATCESTCSTLEQLGSGNCVRLMDAFLECRVANSACTIGEIADNCLTEAGAYEACVP
jgi:hypothetical protein